MSDFTFNLLTDPWIPCDMKSENFELLSIQDILLDAPNISEISADNPLIIASIYRLLLTILHRNFGPKNYKEWSVIYAKGCFDNLLLQNYFSKWIHKFELFNEPQNRFYQIDISEVTKTSPISYIDYVISSGNNAALFNHSWDVNVQPRSFAEVAQLLVTFQNYSLSGLGGFYYNKDGKSRIYYSYSPLIGGAVVLVKGNNVFDTLMNNFIRYDDTHPFALQKDKNDIPFWEREDKDLEEEERMPYGYLDYLTWQSRKIWLIPEDFNGTAGVEKIHLAQGEKLSKNWNEDPQMAYKLEENEKSSINVSPSRLIWRDAEALLQVQNKPASKYISPRAINWIGNLAQRGLVDYSNRYKLETYGLCNDPQHPANILSYHRSYIPLPLTILKDQSFVNAIGLFIEKCEKIAKILNNSLYFFAKDYLSSKRESEGGNNKIVKDFIGNHQIKIKYWNAIELYFYKFIVDLEKESDPTQQNELVKFYLKNQILQKARELWNHIKDNTKSDPRALEPLIKNSRIFRKKLYNIITFT